MEGKQIFGKYQVIKSLGNGAYGSVFKALNTQTNKKYALKVIEVLGEQNRKTHKHLIMISRELYILYKLSTMKENTFTIKLVDVFMNDEAYQDPTKLKKLFLVTNLENFDLSSLFTKTNLLSYEQLQILVYNLLNSLRFIHECGIIHRDLKPNNVLINQHCQINLCDFGWARSIPIESDISEGKRARALTLDVCTRFYRPPEIILRCTNYDQAADIWSFGCIVSEMLRFHLCSTTESK